MRRVLCLWYPNLPLDRLARKGDPRFEGPFAITAEEKNAWRITHANEPAFKNGVASGQSLADARAICPALLTAPADPVREAGLLRSLRRWADQFSPVVALHEPDALLLDIAGGAHLFGGETDMAQTAIQRLVDMGLSARAGLADTRRAALALARFGSQKIAIAPSGETQAHIESLPLEALGCDPRALQGMRRAGLKTLGQIFAIKSADLARRYGVDVMQSRAALLGHHPDPVRLSAPDPVYAARMSLPDPVGHHKDVLEIVERLSARICDRLKDRNKGARQFHLTLRCVDSGDHHLQIGFAKPCCESAHILQQLSFKLDKIKLTYGADWFRLSAGQIEAIHPKQPELSGYSQADDALAQIISTIGNRIGFDRVERVLPQASHLPERSFLRVEAASTEIIETWPEAALNRPLVLFEYAPRLSISLAGRPPKEFEYQGRSFHLGTARGPERLSPEWWRTEDPRTRDYWAVQTLEGPRFWLLTYPGHAASEWYLAGRFA
ncbi:MAG: nucleotidyltransferase [Ponticaulis sp.]|nr:nucleotidyltransferase [Ponticaulis sp.]